MIDPQDMTELGPLRTQKESAASARQQIARMPNLWEASVCLVMPEQQLEISVASGPGNVPELSERLFQLRWPMLYPRQLTHTSQHLEIYPKGAKAGFVARMVRRGIPRGIKGCRYDLAELYFRVRAKPMQLWDDGVVDACSDTDMIMTADRFALMARLSERICIVVLGEHVELRSFRMGDQLVRCERHTLAA